MKRLITVGAVLTCLVAEAQLWTSVPTDNSMQNYAEFERSIYELGRQNEALLKRLREESAQNGDSSGQSSGLPAQVEQNASYYSWLSKQDNQRYYDQINSAMNDGWEADRLVKKLLAEAKERTSHMSSADRLEAQARFWAAQSAMFDSMKRSAKLQGDSAARQAVSSADRDYSRATGRDFDADRRPYSSGSTQDAWDSCNRIHQIFGL